VYDELSISFDNPATDALGYQHVSGKLFCGRDQMELQFKERDRAFRKSETQVISFDYGEIERVRFISKWFRPKFLVLSTRSPEKIAAFPGTEVGLVELRVSRDSIKDAKRVKSLIEFRQSEAFVEESEDRISRGRDSE
tara:strand:+ start:996 stop:1409 length:414 start_codon:yes stop_codon:yes gene_type:complete